MTGNASVPAQPTRPRRAARAGGWLRESRGGLFIIALVVGAGSGLGAVAFRYLIYFFTWLATGRAQFGQDGHAGSSHLPWLGLAFFVVIPVVGGLVYGPLIYRYAREARGHGVPEVMAAVAGNGGRIRPPVSVVKAVASAVCIGTGGSVGREGPIVQIGSALASAFGQWAKMPENRMRILVACGAAGGIAATFNAPVTGVFFGVEIILREFSVDALFMVMLSAMLADVAAIPFLGDHPFLTGFPPGIALHHPRNYLLVALLAVTAALIGMAFKTVVYKMEDLWDGAWGKRPEWARPAVGGIALGLVLLALPQMYGVGYPVMYKALAGGYVLWFLLVLAAGKILACSLTLGIGGSGGVFAPSLFVGATSGMAFGEIADRLLGPGAGQPALYAAVAMGAVFASAARAPLTSVASVAEMSGDYALTLPVMLAVAVATAMSRALSYGTIYTTKLLRRGSDVDRAAPWRAFGDLTAADAMRPFPVPLPVPDGGHREGNAADRGPAGLPGPVTYRRDPQAVYASESLPQTLRQLQAYSRDGLPVLSADGTRLRGWITNASVLQAVAAEIGSLPAQDGSGTGRPPRVHSPTPLRGYQVIEVTITASSPAAGQALGQVSWPDGSIPVSVLRHRRLADPDPGLTVAAGDRVSLLARSQPARSPWAYGPRTQAGQAASAATAVPDREPTVDGTASTVPAKRKGSVGLTSGQAGRFYDRFGRAQDLQAFYEDRAIGDLVSHGRFAGGRAVLEAGCGTGRLAARLLDGALPADARYLGADISSTMTALARARLQPYGARARVIRADVTRSLPAASGTFDRFVAVYLLDLLAPADATLMLAEARRILRPGGLLCTASLTPGATPATRLVSEAWTAAWSRAPWLTGGCRPVIVAPLLEGWHIEHHAQVSAWALTSEIVIAST